MYDLVVMVASAGGIEALQRVLGGLPANFPAPIAIVQHRSPSTGGILATVLQRATSLRVKDAEHLDPLRAGTVFLAPPDRHLVVEEGLLMLSGAPKVRHVRPAGDVLFESAAHAYRQRLIAVVLTGGDGDGAAGVRTVKAEGGTVLVQDDATAENIGMPRAAISTGVADVVLPLDRIAGTLLRLAMTGDDQGIHYALRGHHQNPV